MGSGHANRLILIGKWQNFGQNLALEGRFRGQKHWFKETRMPGPGGSVRTHLRSAVSGLKTMF